MNYAASGEAMERQEEAMSISGPGENVLSSVEAPLAHESHRETHTLNLLLVPLAALLLWLLVGGWLYFFGLPVR